jgi:hypothetical protein
MLDPENRFGKLPLRAWGITVMDELISRGELEFPQREAAFFYGLFLRGHSLDELRRDISVPPDVLARWDREPELAPHQRAALKRMAEFRRHVLAIFESLVGFDRTPQRLQ